VYRVITHPDALDQIAALPTAALAGYAEVLDALELAPWNGPPQNKGNPEGALRRRVFGPGAAGHVVYLILEAQHEIHVVLVQWLGVGRRWACSCDVRRYVA